MRVDLYKKVQKLSINSANSKTTGGLINILNNDSIGVGIGLVIFCFLSLLKNIKKEKSNKWYKL